MFNKLLLVLALTTVMINISCRRNPTSPENTAPIAAITINPTSGTTETTFNFDAGNSTDEEDETSVLQVRWDWENDGGWDTDYRTIKTITHKYSQPGTYTIVLEVKDMEGLTSIATDTVNVSIANTVPTASFTISPTSGVTTTTFNFDASASSDNEDAMDVLQVRWDWNNDGTYDTNYNTAKTATHQYTTEGTYTVKLEVKDSEGLTNTNTQTVIVSEANTAPTASFTVNPTTGTINTIFNFDASGSSDNEDATDVLQVRWDWNNDGTYDTNFSTTKIATNQFSKVGTYTVKLEVKDSEGLTNTNNQAVTIANTAPTASFSVNPATGTVNTVFNFDASGSSDNEDATDVLQVRWDWNNDGTYDTNYNTAKTATHQYTLEGSYTIKLEVKDSEGWLHSNTKIVTVQQPSTVITFSDANFEALIRVTLNKPTGNITDSDLETITSLSGGGWNISNISGIEYCTNLQTLTLWGNQISNISSLSNLLNLKVIGMDANQIIDIYPLVQNSGIGSGDIVYLTNNPLSSASINTYIPQLEARGVTVHYGSGTVITFSDANFEALIRVTLNKPTGNITDSDMETITSLSGGGWNISNISGIEYCTNLQTLTLWGNQISNISSLSNLLNLKVIGMDANQIIDIYPLVQNSGIGSGDIVYLTNNPLSSTSINTYIPQLEARGVTVHYGSGTVITFSDANFEALIRVTLNKPTGNITDSDMETIITITGSNWNISNISGIEYCTNLQTLNLEGNHIVDISDLRSLTGLNWIDLSNNQVDNIYPLVQNSGINNGDHVYLNNNPLNSTSINTYIPQLEARGVTVHHNAGTVILFYDANFEALIRLTLSKPTGDITDSDMETIITITGSNWNISDISEIIYCTNLQTLNLEHNQITGIGDLIGLTNLNWIDLSSNLIVNINALVQNSGIGNGDIVYLNNNPLNSTSINTYIPQLEARGVTVHH